MSAATAAEPIYPHIAIDGRGVAHVAGKTMKVVELVMAQLAHGWSPEELHFQFPHITMSEVHAALAYYWDHRADLDADIQRRTAFAEQARQKATVAPVVQRLRTLRADR